ncbi:MAG: DMT family transporter [Thaumarchaeota archaeon]|nr:DMT family transporter [Nitrososphaerota archaeon]
MRASKNLAVTAAFASVLLSFSINSIITRYLVSGSLVGPFPLTIIRFSSGLVTLWLVSGKMSGKVKRTRAGRRDVSGAFFLGAYAFAISFGYNYIPAAAGALVFYSMVVLTMSSYSVVGEGEKVSVPLVAGLLLGVIGIVTMTFGGIGSVSSLGVALMAVTGTAWGLYSVYGKSSESYFGYTYNSFLYFGLANVFLVLLVTALQGTRQWTAIALPNLALALYMGMVSTALSYVIWNGVLKRVSASQGGLTQLLVPIITSIMGVVLLSEEVTFGLVAGGSLILLGIYVNGSRRTGPRAPQAST